MTSPTDPVLGSVSGLHSHRYSGFTLRLGMSLSNLHLKHPVHTHTRFWFKWSNETYSEESYLEHLSHGPSPRHLSPNQQFLCEAAFARHLCPEWSNECEDWSWGPWQLLNPRRAQGSHILRQTSSAPSILCPFITTFKNSLGNNKQQSRWEDIEI